MFNWIKKIMSKGFWHSLALVIVILVAGPEMVMGMELMAMIELLGASTFVLMYVSGIRLWLSKLATKFVKFERYSYFFIPDLSALKSMPSLAYHAIPERTVVVSFLSITVVCMLCFYINMFISA